MAEMNNNETYQPMTFDAIKIGQMCIRDSFARVISQIAEKGGDAAPAAEEAPAAE